jgi:hypothetical protein
MGLYENIRSKTEDTQTSGSRVHQRGDLVPMPEMLGGPAVDYPSVPFREPASITADNPRTLPVVLDDDILRAGEENLPAHGPGRGTAILREAALKMLMKMTGNQQRPPEGGA